MKIYLTRDSAISVLVGGLERIHVWFCPIEYHEFKKYNPDEYAFLGSEKMGCFEGGRWYPKPPAHLEVKNLSFGKVFGYADTRDKDLNELAEFVWKKLVEHFGNTEMSDEWKRREDEGLSKIRDFYLEIDLLIKMTIPV